MKLTISSRRLLLPVILLMLCLLGAGPARAACVSGACVSAGPRLASINTAQGALLNPVLGGLLGTSLNLTVADWNALAQGEVKTLDFLNALQAAANVSSPAQALGASVTPAQVAAALQAAAHAQARTSLETVLATLRSQMAGAGATIRIGDLLALGMDAGTLANNTLNALDMLSGVIQLYNYRNVLTTPQPITVSGGALGMAGLVNSVQLYVQVIEPPLYTCGPGGTQFHSAAIRLKLKLDLVTLNPSTATLTSVPGVTSATVAISRLDLYLETARGEGSLGAVDAAAAAVTLQVAPGVADAYIGSIADGVFFNRSRTLSSADVDYGQVGTLVLNGVNVALEVKSTARGQAPFATSLTLSGSFPQTRTVSTSALFVTNLANSLASNMALRTTIVSTGLSALLLNSVTSLLNGSLQAPLKTLVVNTISPVLAPVLSGIADPLLKLLGVGIGEMVVTVNGICQACDAFKLTKAVDKANAAPGAAITYTITYQNTGTTTLNGLKVSDTTPAFTVYAGGTCDVLGAGLSACSIAKQPQAGAGGALEWNFSGALQPGASGSVKFTVTLQ